MGRSTIPPEIRAAAIADLHDGEQPAVIAEKYRQYGVSADQVRKWKQRFVTASVTESVTDGVTPTRPGRVVTIRPSMDRQQLDLTELIKENLRAKLIATQRIVEYAANNPAWLEKQTAADLGEFFERVDRSSIAILDRMAGAGRANTANGSEDPAPSDMQRPDPVD